MSKVDIEVEAVNFSVLRELMAPTFAEAEKAVGLDLVLSIGPTGSGKTTGMYKILGVPLIEEDDEEGLGTRVVVADPALETYGKIGHSDVSETTHPRVVEYSGVALCDLPGFDDTRTGLEVNEKLCSVAGLPLVVQQAKSIKAVMIYFDVRMLDIGIQRGQPFKKLVATLSNLFSRVNTLPTTGNIMFVLTHMPERLTVQRVIKVVRARIKKITAKIKETQVLIQRLSKQLSDQLPELAKKMGSVKSKKEQQEVAQLIAKTLKSEDTPHTVKESLSRLRVAMASVLDDLGALSVLSLLERNAAHCYVFRASGEDDAEKVRRKIDDLKHQEPIPREQFAFNAMQGSEWSIWRKVIDKTSLTGEECANTLKGLIDEIVAADAYSDMRANQTKTYQELKSQLDEGDEIKLEDLNKELNALSKSLRESVEGSVVGIEKKIVRLKEKLGQLDVSDPVSYQPPSLKSIKIGCGGQHSCNSMAAFSSIAGIVFLPFEPLIRLGAAIVYAGNGNDDHRDVAVWGSFLFHKLAAEATSFVTDEVRFAYDGVPFVECKTSHEIADFDRPPRPGVYFSDSGKFDNEKGIISVYCGRYRTLESAIASISLTVEKRLHPDIAREISIIQESIRLLESGSMKCIKKDLQRLQQGFDADKALLDKIDDLSQWRANLTQSLENRIAEGAESAKHIGLANGKLKRGLATSHAEYIAYQDAFYLSKLMLPLIGAESGAVKFLETCEQEELLQKVSLLLKPSAASSEEQPSARIQTNLLAGGGGAGRVTPSHASNDLSVTH